MSDESGDPERGFERQDLQDLVAERVTAGEAYRSLHLGLGLVLFRVGKGWVVLLEMLLLLIAVLGTLAIQSPLPALLAVIVLFIVGVYTEVSLEDWVDEYNARVDEEIRQALGRDGEPRRARWLDD
jgi:hypothetical protein